LSQTISYSYSDLTDPQPSNHTLKPNPPLDSSISRNWTFRSPFHISGNPSNSTKCWWI